MAYIVDHVNNTLLDDEPKKVGKLTPKQHKQMMNYLVRKKDAVPPKTETIKKFKNQAVFVRLKKKGLRQMNKLGF